MDLDVTRLLWVGKERTIESFQGFSTTIREEITSKIDLDEPPLFVRLGNTMGRRADGRRRVGPMPFGLAAVGLCAQATMRRSKEDTHVNRRWRVFNTWLGTLHCP